MTYLTILFGTAGNDTLNGTAGADLLTGEGGNDRLNGGDGDDILNAGAGTNQIDAGAGNDIILIDGTAVNGPMGIPANGIVGGAGFDTVVYTGLAANYHITQVSGGALTVSNLTNGARDVMTEIEALRFDDSTITLSGTASNIYVGSFNADTLTGGDTDDMLVGLGGNDLLNGGAGNDTLIGGAGTNQIDAGAGDDLVVIDGTAVNGPMGVPANGIVGGAGYDTVAYSGLVSNYRITQTAGGPLTVVNLTTGARDMMTEVEKLVFADSEVVLSPANSAPVVTGAVAVTLAEGASLTSLDALAMASDAEGDALSVVGLPANLPQGVTFDAASQSFVIDPQAAAFDALNSGDSLVLTIDYGITDGTAVTLAQAQITVEGVTDPNRIIGTGGNDKLTGTAAADEMQGLAGKDSLNGADGDDTLDGGAGADSLLGGAGDDRLVYDAADLMANGGTGTDVLVLAASATVNLAKSDHISGDAGVAKGFESVDASGAVAVVSLRGSNLANSLVAGAADDVVQGAGGADVLTGGAGADHFVFALASDSSATAADVITDFQSGLDLLDLRQIDAVAGGANNAFVWIGSAAFTAAGQLRYDAATGLVEADVTGDRIADLVLHLEAGQSLSASDILL